MSTWIAIALEVSKKDDVKPQNKQTRFLIMWGSLFVTEWCGFNWQFKIYSVVIGLVQPFINWGQKNKSWQRKWYGWENPIKATQIMCINVQYAGFRIWWCQFSFSVICHTLQGVCILSVHQFKTHILSFHTPMGTGVITYDKSQETLLWID